MRLAIDHDKPNRTFNLVNYIHDCIPSFKSVKMNNYTVIMIDRQDEFMA
jgi:hypothetical protein